MSNRMVTSEIFRDSFHLRFVEILIICRAFRQENYHQLECGQDATEIIPCFNEYTI